MGQNICDNSVTQSRILNLPAEIIINICAQLIPSNHTFLLNARGPDSQSNKSQAVTNTRTSPRIRGTPLLQEEEPLPQHPATIFRDSGTDIFGLLLLHSQIHIRIVECLYSNNIFYTPDLNTLTCLRNTLSPLAISNVRCIRLDACGFTTCSVRGYNHSYSWNQFADINIISIPELFPGLRELRLGGIGPGIVHRRIFTYRGTRCVRDTEIPEVWTLDNISLISRMVGVSASDSADSVEIKDKVTNGRHSLSNGRVLCMRYDQANSSSLPRGSHRLHGTRIVRRAEGVRVRSMEYEVDDVDAVLAKTRKVVEDFTAAGLSEVSIHDVSR